MSTSFRAQLVLMMLNQYGYGDHVSDPAAFSSRVRSILRKRTALALNETLDLFSARDSLL